MGKVLQLPLATFLVSQDDDGDPGGRAIRASERDSAETATVRYQVQMFGQLSCLLADWRWKRLRLRQGFVRI